MRTAAVLALVFAAALCGQKMPVAEQKAFVAQYCSGCHNDKLRSGGFSWTTVDPAHPDQNAEQAEKVIRKVGAGLLAPPGMSPPSTAALRNFTRTLESAIDAAAANNPNPGRPALRRLN